MRLAWAVAAGLLLGIGVAWWLARESPAQTARKQERAEQAADDARPVLYRWRDAAGALHITDTPPKGREYERIDKMPAAGIVVDSGRD